MSAVDIGAWLLEPITVRNQYKPDEIVPRHQRLSQLISANGGIEVSGWGIMDNGGPGGHIRGLEQNQALELIYYSGIIAGLEMAGVDFHSIFMPYLEAYQVAWLAKDRALEPTGATS